MPVVSLDRMTYSLVRRLPLRRNPRRRGPKGAVRSQFLSFATVWCELTHDCDPRNC